MNVMINKTAPSIAGGKRVPAPQHASSLDKNFGEWGRVETLHSDDNTVDVYLDTGLFLKRIPVASKEWVIFGEDTDDKDFNAGERNLPPVQSRVFIIKPTLTYNDCFVAPFSGFNTIDRNISSPFMDDDRKKIKERITPSGWHITDDYVTGSHKAVSPDEKTSLEIDYGTEDEQKEDNPELHLNLFENIKADVIAEDNVHLSVFDEVVIDHKKGDSCTVKVYDTELVIKNGEVSIKPKETIIEVTGNMTVKTSGNTKLEASGSVDVKGANVTVEASAVLTLKTGDAAPFMPNIMPKCPLGPVHGGKLAGIVKLCGA